MTQLWVNRVKGEVYRLWETFLPGYKTCVFSEPLPPFLSFCIRCWCSLYKRKATQDKICRGEIPEPTLTSLGVEFSPPRLPPPVCRSVRRWLSLLSGPCVPGVLVLALQHCSTIFQKSVVGSAGGDELPRSHIWDAQPQSQHPPQQKACEPDLAPGAARHHHRVTRGHVSQHCLDSHPANGLCSSATHRLLSTIWDALTAEMGPCSCG